MERLRERVGFVVVRLLRDVPQRLAIDGLVLEIAGDLRHEWSQSADRPGQRPRGKLAPLRAGRGQPRDPFAQCGDRRARDAANLGVDIALTDRDDLDASTRLTQAVLGEEPLGVGDDERAVAGVGRQAVQHDDERDLALFDALQHVPRDEIGVARCRRDEHAEVA